MHGRAVTELHARHAPPRQLAPHLLVAPVGTLPDAADILVEAAAESATAGDHEVAVACLERALTERPGDLGIRERLGRSLLRVSAPRGRPAAPAGGRRRRRRPPAPGRAAGRDRHRHPPATTGRTPPSPSW